MYNKKDPINPPKFTHLSKQGRAHQQVVVDILAANNVNTIPPCKYTFSNSTTANLDLGRMIKSIGISAKIGLLGRIAATDPGLAPLVSGMLSVESRHDAWLRHIVNGTLTNASLDTGISAVWAYNLALSMTVPGSCPVEVALPILPKLNISEVSELSFPKQMEFMWDASQATFAAEAGKKLLIGWVNGFNAPIYSPLNITSRGRGSAVMPEMQGTSFAVVTAQTPNNNEDLALATLAGPAMILLP